MIRIVLADDHKMFAKGLEGLLEDEEDFLIEGIFSNGVELMGFLESNDVDIVITDMNMPMMDGMGVIQAVKALNPLLKIIVLSMYDEEAIFLKCQKLGANAYVLKDADPDELIYTIREVMEGTFLMSFQKMLSQNKNIENYPDAYRDKIKLSNREIQIIKMIKEGMLNKEIAASLHLSPYTIESHRKKIHQKLGVNTAIELVNKANEMNI